jgi:hypothetical protein
MEMKAERERMSFANHQHKMPMDSWNSCLMNKYVYMNHVLFEIQQSCSLIIGHKVCYETWTFKSHSLLEYVYLLYVEILSMMLEIGLSNALFLSFGLSSGSKGRLGRNAKGSI